MLADRVTFRVGGGWDRYGNPLPEHDSDPVPAQMTPLDSSERVQQGVSTVTTPYRLIVRIPAAIAGEIDASTAITWNGRRYEVDGDYEDWRLHGRRKYQAAVVHRI